MRFAARVKEEITRIIPAQNCCRCWELAGMTHTLPAPGETLHVRLRQAGMARKFFLLQKGTGAGRPRLTIVQQGRNRYDIELPGFPGLSQADGLPANRCCRRAFIRGAFLAKGSVTDPDHTYHLEINVKSQPFAHLLVEVLASLGVKAQEAAKRRSHVVYLKDGEAISEFLRLVEAHQSLLAWEGVRVVKSVKNNINRLVNAETANVDKTVAAAMAQTAGIEYLIRTLGLENLPVRLRDIARARMEMPYASITELAESLTPHISKSAANHRLRRLHELALNHGYKPDPDGKASATPS